MEDKSTLSEMEAEGSPIAPSNPAPQQPSQPSQSTQSQPPHQSAWSKGPPKTSGQAASNTSQNQNVHSLRIRLSERGLDFSKAKEIQEALKAHKELISRVVPRPQENALSLLFASAEDKKSFLRLTVKVGEKTLSAPQPFPSDQEYYSFQLFFPFPTSVIEIKEALNPSKLFNLEEHLWGKSEIPTGTYSGSGLFRSKPPSEITLGGIPVRVKSWNSEETRQRRLALKEERKKKKMAKKKAQQDDTPAEEDKKTESQDPQKEKAPQQSETTPPEADTPVQQTKGTSATPDGSSVQVQVPAEASQVSEDEGPPNSEGALKGQQRSQTRETQRSEVILGEATPGRKSPSYSQGTSASRARENGKGKRGFSPSTSPTSQKQEHLFLE